VPDNGWNSGNVLMIELLSLCQLPLKRSKYICC
jgi:hypothetical protein